MCCHLALLGLVQSKPSWSAQACTAQAQAELDGTTCAVYPAPQTLGLVVCGRLMTSLLLWPMAWRAWPWPPLQVLNFVPRSEIQLGGFKKGGLPSPCLLTTKPKRVSCSLRRVFTVFTRFCRRIKYIDQLLFCIESCCTAPPCTGNELTSWRFCQATARQKKHATSARRLIHTI